MTINAEDEEDDEADKASWQRHWVVIVDDDTDDANNVCDASVFADESGHTINNFDTLDGNGNPVINWGTTEGRRYLCVRYIDSENNAGYGMSNVVDFDSLSTTSNPSGNSPGSKIPTETTDLSSEEANGWSTILLITSLAAAIILPIILYNMYRKGHHLRQSKF